MSNAQPDDRTTLTPAVKTALDALRRGVRRYVWLEGCAAALVWLGAAFWGTLIVDWFFEPSVVVRVVMLVAVGVILAAILIQWIGRRTFVPITDANAAMLLERRFPQLGDSLLTAVELQPSADCNPTMFAQTCCEADQRIAGLDVQRVFNRSPLRRKYFVGALLVLSVAFFAVLLPEAFAIWAVRTLTLSNELWPRDSYLEIEGFPDGVARIARGSDLEVVVRADTTMPVVPQIVEVRYRTDGGNRGRATMDRRGAARGPEAPFQEYAYTFRSVLNDIHFDVVGGDARVADCWIQVVDSPTVSEMTLECRLPDYIGREPRRLPVTGVMQIPAGSRVVVRAGAANKDLTRVQVARVVADRVQPVTMPDAPLTPDRRGFSYTLPPLLTDTTLLFTLTDADGIRSRDPVRLALVAVPDQPPQMAVQLDGIGTAVTPQARIPVAGEIVDDYGISRAWFDYSIDQQNAGRHIIADFSDRGKTHPTELKLTDAALELREMGLKPGQKVVVTVKAADRCDLNRGPNVANGERWTLDVVTPQQLRTMLEARELVLRQRFDRMIQEMTETRDILARLELGPPKSKRASDSASTTDSTESGNESSDESPERQRTLRVLRVEGAVTNCRKSTQEVLGLAEAFDDICKQLVNNRIDTAELNDRLHGGIAVPLHAIAAEMFPELDRRLESLRTALDDAKNGPGLRDRAHRQADAILLTMQKVRDRMIELEDFNEALDLLRGIIQGQKQLRDQTEKRHKEKIRDLLKD